MRLERFLEAESEGIGFGRKRCLTWSEHLPRPKTGLRDRERDFRLLRLASAPNRPIIEEFAADLSKGGRGAVETPAASCLWGNWRAGGLSMTGPQYRGFTSVSRSIVETEAEPSHDDLVPTDGNRQRRSEASSMVNGFVSLIDTSPRGDIIPETPSRSRASRHYLGVASMSNNLKCRRSVEGPYRKRSWGGYSLVVIE